MNYEYRAIVDYWAELPTRINAINKISEGWRIKQLFPLGEKFLILMERVKV